MSVVCKRQWPANARAGPVEDTAGSGDVSRGTVDAVVGESDVGVTVLVGRARGFADVRPLAVDLPIAKPPAPVATARTTIASASRCRQPSRRGPWTRRFLDGD